MDVPTTLVKGAASALNIVKVNDAGIGRFIGDRLPEQISPGMRPHGLPCLRMHLN
jgi:hypothetical protein